MKIEKLKIENLSKVSGLPISFKSGRLLFDKNLVSSPVKSRSFKEEKSFLKDDQASRNIKNVYLMYRNIRRKQDSKKIKENNLRYDITVIFPAILGKELPKTIGHYHPYKKKTGVAYPEIYEVLSGKALFLLQNKELKSEYLIKAKKGGKVVVPPGFGHITINAANTPLIVANATADHFKSQYKFFKARRGGAYYILKNGENILVEKNPKYRTIPALKMGWPKKLKNMDKPLYEIMVKNTAFLDFLNNPEKYKGFLSVKNLFKF